MYRVVLEINMTKREVTRGDNMLQLVPCKVELKNPGPWCTDVSG